jgi:hypothetical protein
MAEKRARRTSLPNARALDLPPPYTARPSGPSGRPSPLSQSSADAIDRYREIIAAGWAELERRRRTGQPIAQCLAEIRAAQARIDLLHRESETKGERAAGVADQFMDIVDGIVKEKYPDLALEIANALLEASTAQPTDPELEGPAAIFKNPYLDREQGETDHETEESTT